MMGGIKMKIFLFLKLVKECCGSRDWGDDQEVLSHPSGAVQVGDWGYGQPDQALLWPTSHGNDETPANL